MRGTEIAIAVHNRLSRTMPERYSVIHNTLKDKIASCAKVESCGDELNLSKMSEERASARLRVYVELG